jgi:hypothetical protein
MKPVKYLPMDPFDSEVLHSLMYQAKLHQKRASSESYLGQCNKSSKHILISVFFLLVRNFGALFCVRELETFSKFSKISLESIIIIISGRGSRELITKAILCAL